MITTTLKKIPLSTDIVVSVDFEDNVQNLSAISAIYTSEDPDDEESEISVKIADIVKIGQLSVNNANAAISALDFTRTLKDLLDRVNNLEVLAKADWEQATLSVENIDSLEETTVSEGFNIL